MGNALVLWLSIVVIGILTFGMRLAFIAAEGRLTLPVVAREGLRLVPVAVLVAIIVPALLMPAGQVWLAPNNARLVAGIVAALVAWRTRNTLLTIAVGMVSLWVLQAVLQ